MQVRILSRGRYAKDEMHTLEGVAVPDYSQARFLPTGSLGLDIALGGGWERGYIHEIWGEPGSGKTTLGLNALEEADEADRSGPSLWMILGSEIPQYRMPGGAMLAFPYIAEAAFEIMTAAAEHGVPLIVVDSANGLIRKRELAGDPDYTPHPQREYKDELNALKRACKTQNSTVLFLSRPRDRDRQPVRGTGISEKARSRVQLRLSQLRQDGSRDIDARAHGRDDLVRFSVVPGYGIDWPQEVAQLAIFHGLAERRGAWVCCGDAKYQGLGGFMDEIRSNGHLAVRLVNDIRSKAGINH